MQSLDEHGILLGRLIEASVATKDAVQALNQRQDSMAEQVATQAAQIQSLYEQLAKGEQGTMRARDEREKIRRELHQAQASLAAIAKGTRQLSRAQPERSRRELWAERGGIGAGGGVAGMLIAKAIEYIMGLFG